MIEAALAGVLALAAVMSAAAAAGSWRAARKASLATQSLGDIEAARRHQELMPEFALRLSEVAEGGKFKHLEVELLGPIALQRLKALEVRIRDDRPGRAQEVNYPRPDQQAMMVELIAQQVWGPYRFTPGVGPSVGSVKNPSDEHGRSCRVNAPLEVGEGLRFQLEPTVPPWLGNASGPDRHEELWLSRVGHEIRLTIRAQSDQGEWVIPLEVEAMRGGGER
ncbi:hypothetical protein [Nocardioides acrostichi]|uniref:General secretion pathway protein GspJ n=1 Tax=Nocardioides acrostichi TaxID=2784339 RepID=A0A930V541_9ACTN|nr:hypothetical protein [Nocardioides acrostichi]MBF4164011.1 hypothetical protein [Nocardioides acrostichi]